MMEELDDESIISGSFSSDSKDHSLLEDDLQEDKFGFNKKKKEKSLPIDRSRISHEFAFTKGIMSSTLLDVEVGNSSKTENETNLSMITPRKVKARVLSSSSSSDSIEVVSDSDNDIIELTSEDESRTRSVPHCLQKKTMKQTTLDSLVFNKKPESPQAVIIKEEEELINAIDVTPKEMAEQKGKVSKLEMEMQKLKNMLRTVNLDSLPDKGQTIKDRHATSELQLKQEVEKMLKMVVSKEDPPEVPKKSVRSWDEIQAAANAVVPRTFGRQAVGTYNAQKAVTMDRLHHLHESLKTCPNEHTLAEDPAGLNVEMMPHQKRALAWLLWREKEKPSGGILADDMGLGKTLTMISVIAKTIEAEGRPSDVDSTSNKYLGGSLIVCPASILHQWSGELEKRTRRGLLSCELYHGPKRETKAKKLAMHDMVITTYAIVLNECERSGAVFRVKWRRIILDEAHQIRNYKSQSSEAVCRLSAQSRWALTGTPVHNKELDMYALLKFLRCTPFDDLAVWKRWVSDKSTGGQERLHTVISSLMLRRTKVELMEKGALQSMPARKWELKAVELGKAEMDVYQKILLFSRTLFAQFLHQRAEKNQDAIDLKYQNLGSQPNKPNQEYFKMRDKLLRFHRVRDIKQHEILVLLLRLRQICCHPSLITSMLREDMEDIGGDENVDETNLIDQLNKLVLNDDEYDANCSDPAAGLYNQENAAGLSEVAKSILNPSNPVFSKENISSKIKVVLDVLKEKVMNTDDKAIIVSQWPSFLRLIAYHLKRHNIPFDQLDGSIPVNKRMIMIDKFNNPTDKMKVLLLSLTAGGVGLNLVGANHLFLLDLHWNPQLENQAQDRIYRVGQQKPVFVYKFMATDTIEKRILDLQEKKLDIANSMLTGTKQAITNKLSLEDLKLLFDM